ncbi:hypothetical protein [Capnocytophaga canimorsus]|uniref:hypothetical protein n=1 Tax=Capnocytophaga canimorsus TaxID=28188 RepID=UPI000D6DF3EC|nr:hypothetical protein [Capnocytophaga canimorsus]AWL77562.1 hypothetical protein DKB58_00530 [Capnocytophaga canimorsus]AYW36114.1 hypothetical protein D8L92_01385 [Capnocytophaga canimorsus]
MASKIYFTNEEMLQNAKVLFETLENNSKIAEKLDDYGYSQSEIAKGKALYEKAQAQYGSNKKETEEERVAYLNFKQKMDETSKSYREHRNKAKLIFKNNEEAKVRLALKGSPSKSIVALLEEMTLFYKNLAEQETLRTPLKRVKITQQIITEKQSEISQTKDLYAIYSQEKNESEQATKDKNKAFEALDKWTRELYSYAKYALADEPQFLQMFGRAIR